MWQVASRFGGVAPPIFLGALAVAAVVGIGYMIYKVNKLASFSPSAEQPYPYDTVNMPYVRINTRKYTGSAYWYDLAYGITVVIKYTYRTV